MRNLTSIAAVAAAGVVVSAGLLTPAPARAAAVGSCYGIDYTVYHEPGGCNDETTNYSESGVQIWNDPAHPTTVEGTGAAGGAFKAMDFRSVGTFTTCDNGRPVGRLVLGNRLRDARLGLGPGLLPQR